MLSNFLDSPRSQGLVPWMFTAHWIQHSLPQLAVFDLLLYHNSASRSLWRRYFDTSDQDYCHLPLLVIVPRTSSPTPRMVVRRHFPWNWLITHQFAVVSRSSSIIAPGSPMSIFFVFSGIDELLFDNIVGTIPSLYDDRHCGSVLMQSLQLDNTYVSAAVKAS